MKNRSNRPVSTIAFSVGSAAIALPLSEVSAIRELCKTPCLTSDGLSHLLHGLNIRHSDFCDALFALSNFAAQTTVPVDHFLTTYAILRRLAYAEPDSARAAAQEAVWIVFCAAGGGIGVETVSCADWLKFQSKLGEHLGGVQSLPCQESVERMRKAWRKAGSPFQSTLTFNRLLNALRIYDAGLVKCLRAMGFLLACHVADAGNALVGKPRWEDDAEDVFLGQFLTYAVCEAVRTRDINPPDSRKTTDAKELEDRSVERPKNTSLKRPNHEQSSASRPHVTFGLPHTDNTQQLWDDKSPTAVLPASPRKAEMVRRTAKAGGKTPFHIDYSSLQLGEKIGSGAYGDVYKGTFLMSPVAVKMFHVNLQQKPKDDQDPSQLNRMSTMTALQRFASVNSQSKYRNFVREVEMMSVVRHPNLVLYMGACGDPVTPLCIVSELFTGGSLFEFLHGNAQFRPSLEMALSFSVNIARGMFYLHSSQPSILHRDLKSRNVLLSGRKNKDDGIPHVVICDFGLCQLFGEDGQSSNQMGTASYMSPDVIRGEKYEAADDVYSYGILLHEIFTGCVPFEGKRAMQVMFQVSNEGLRPSFGDENVPKSIKALIEDCWHKERSKRPAFDEIIERLDDIEVGLTCCV